MVRGMEYFLVSGSWLVSLLKITHLSGASHFPYWYQDWTWYFFNAKHKFNVAYVKMKKFYNIKLCLITHYNKDTK